MAFLLNSPSPSSVSCRTQPLSHNFCELGTSYTSNVIVVLKNVYSIQKIKFEEYKKPNQLSSVPNR